MTDLPARHTKVGGAQQGRLTFYRVFCRLPQLMTAMAVLIWTPAPVSG